AKSTLNDEGMSFFLSSAITKILAQLRSSSIYDKYIAPNLNDNHNGKYNHYYTGFAGIIGGFGSVLTTPSKYNIAYKISALHDLTDILWANDETRHFVLLDDKHANVTVFSDYLLKEPDLARIPYTLNQQKISDSSSFRRKDGTLLERSAPIKSARKMQMPISAGPTYTTSRYMTLAEKSGCTTGEKTAIAWSLFAFWCLEYYKSHSPIHRFHFVMDMASNFGVEYLPFYYPDSIPRLHIPRLGPFNPGTPQPTVKV
ncbi:hypothetical protein HRJ46_23280, partial [Vibrio coralliilyticus]